MGSFNCLVRSGQSFHFCVHPGMMLKPTGCCVVLQPFYFFRFFKHGVSNSCTCSYQSYFWFSLGSDSNKVQSNSFLKNIFGNKYCNYIFLKCSKIIWFLASGNYWANNFLKSKLVLMKKSSSFLIFLKTFSIKK